MLNLPNGFLVPSQNAQTQSSPITLMMMPSTPFFTAFQPAFSQMNNAIPTATPPLLVMPTPQIQPAQLQFYFPQQASSEQQLNLIQQQHQQQQSLQYFYAQLIQNQQQQQKQQQQQLQFQYALTASASCIPSQFDPNSLGNTLNQQHLQLPLFMCDSKNINTADQMNKLQDTVSQTAIIQDEANKLQLAKYAQENLNLKAIDGSKFAKETLSLNSSDYTKNSKKRTSVTSTASTASNNTNNGNESNWSNSQLPLNSQSLNDQSPEEEAKKKKFLSAFEPNIQAILQQMHDQALPLFTKNNDTQSVLMIAQNRRCNNSNTSSSQESFEDEGLQDLVNSNSYLKWAIQANRTCSFANESISALVSTNQKYSNLFKLKKKIKKQLANKKLTHMNSHSTKSSQQNDNISFNQSQENQLQEINKFEQQEGAAQAQIAGCQNINKIIQKAEYNDGNDGSYSQSSYKNIQNQVEEDSFEDEIGKSTINKQSLLSKDTKQKLSEDIILRNADFLKQLTIKSNAGSYKDIKAACTCKQSQQDDRTQDNLLVNSTNQSPCSECMHLTFNEQTSINKENIDKIIQGSLKKELMDIEQDLTEIEEEEEDNCNNKCNPNQLTLKEEENIKNISSKKVINSKFHNMNKLFMYKLLSSFYLENLERLGVPFYIREILKKLISLVKLSSKQQSQYQSKQKTDFFSHDHYNLLFLSLNNQTIQYMRENSNNRLLHLSCFNFDLNQVKLPLESSNNPQHIVEKIEYINVVKKYACEIVLQSDLGEEKDETGCSSPSNQQAAITKQIYTKRALSGIRILNQGMIVRRF